MFEIADEVVIPHVGHKPVQFTHAERGLRPLWNTQIAHPGAHNRSR